MIQQRSMRIFAVSLLFVLLSATLQSCGLFEIIGTAFSRLCEGPFEVSKTVDENDDACLPDDCALREAVITANDCPGPQTIRVPAGTYTLSLAGAGEFAAETGDLNITEPVTIEAVGGEVVIDADGLDRVFHINTGPGSDPTTMTGITIQGGRVDGKGGGIFALNLSPLTLRNVIVRSNQAGSGESPGSGGGLYISGELLADTVSVLGNTALGRGGGVYVESNGSISAGSVMDIFDNQARDNYGGGGLYNMGVVNFAGAVSGNESEWNGGGIHNANQLVMTEGAIEGNTTIGAGGGVSNTGNLELRSVDITRNSAEDGGGLYSYADPRSPVASVARLVDVSFEENHADNWGGGIFNAEGAQLIATRTDLYRNDARSGGGVFNYGEATILEANIGDNTASDGPGGGVANRGLITLTRSTLAANRDGAPEERLGAAALLTEEGHVELLNTTISGHTSSAVVGGVIANVFGSIHGEHVTIASNSGPLFGGHTSSFPAIEFRSSIVVHDSSPACSRPITSLGGNMFDSTDCGMTATDVILAVSGGSPGLDPLANNGGRTRTHALQSSSPAVDAADGSCPGEDQRGVARPVGGGCDIGAYESSFALSGDEPDEGAVIELNFNADVYTIERGECTTLRWQVNGASSISLLGQEVEATGADEVCPSDTTGYTLSAENDADEVSEYLEIAVTEPVDDGPQKGCEVWDSDSNSYVCQVPCQQQYPEQYEVCYK